MKAQFGVRRYFYANNAWYIYMRPGDEVNKTISGTHEVKFIYENGRPIAGPFKTEKLLLKWFDNFIEACGKSRKEPEKCIPDKITNDSHSIDI